MKTGENVNLPRDVTIAKIEAGTITGTRPRIVGRNARLGVHGQIVQEPVVRLHTDSGVVGWGWSVATPEAARDLVGRRLHDVFDPRSGTVKAFLMFDLPMWDLAGRVLSQSVHSMLGDRGGNPVPIYDGSIYFEDLDVDSGWDIGIEHVLDAVRMGLEIGYRAFKVKVGRGFRWMERHTGFSRDVEVLHAIRQLTGPEVRILVDSNNGYTPDEARELMRQAGDSDLFWFEEPFPEDAHESAAFREFMRDAGWSTLLADGESTRPDTETAFTQVLRAGGVDVVQFDFRGYSFTEWVAYLAIIAETGTLAAPHNWHSFLLNYYVAQFGRGCPHFSMGETDTISMPAVNTEGYELVDGMLYVPDTPGFGLDLDPTAFTASQQGEKAWIVS